MNRTTKQKYSPEFIFCDTDVIFLLDNMNKYEIMDIIDEGAYGIVWKAKNRETGVIVAIKQFKDSDEDQFSRKTIQREIKMLKMLKGDYVVEIKEAFKKKGKIYLIFEYFEKNILNLIEKYSSGLQPKLIQKIIYLTIKCLNFLHQKNIIHRDIKPQNILINAEQQLLKLCDFGFARFILDMDQLTQYVATRWYRSPELLVGQRYGKPADIWAVGCILGELVDGQPMFPGQNQMDQLFLIKKNLGNLTSGQVEYLAKNPKFMGMGFPPLRKHQSLQQRYIGKMQKNAMSFLKMCLKMDPNERITADEALQHPYLLELSIKDNQLNNNDQTDLLGNSRKNYSILKRDTSRKNVEQVDDYASKSIESTDSIPKISKNKPYLTKNVSTINGNRSPEPIDHQRTGMDVIYENKPLANYQKKNSQSNLHKGSLKNKQTLQGSSPKLKIKKQTSKRLGKMMSEEKNLNLNVDLSVKINLKINQAKGIQSYQSRLPEIKGVQNNKSTKLHFHNPSEGKLKSIYNHRETKELSKGIVIKQQKM